MEFGLVPKDQKNKEEGNEESSKLAEKQKLRTVPSYNISHKFVTLSLLFFYLIVHVFTQTI